MTSPTPVSFIHWFDEIGIQDIPAVGGKNASLGELRRSLANTSINVPDGFAVTANAYRTFLKSNYLDVSTREPCPSRSSTSIWASSNARGRR